MLKIYKTKEDIKAKEFCDEFINSGTKQKYIMGRAEIAKSIASLVDIDGFIDEFTNDTEYIGKPIVKMKKIPSDALVLIASTVRTLTAQQRAAQFKFRSLDFFSFCKHSKLPTKPMVYRNDFIDDFQFNRHKYELIHSKLKDAISKEQFNSLINFKLSYDLDYMNIFSYSPNKQYFEDFLDLKINGEVFVDSGGFDGYTSTQFIKLCPGYKAIHLFEPEEQNILLAKDNLKKFPKVTFYQIGLSNKKGVTRLDVSGDASKISDNGSVIIKVNRLDNMLDDDITFIKMDIEGSEKLAIEGAQEIIRRNHPRLAIAVYHEISDFWTIPEQIFGIRDDYEIFFRHYTEGFPESVMFFMPLKKGKK